MLSASVLVMLLTLQTGFALRARIFCRNSYRFIFSKGEYNLTAQGSPPHGKIHYFTYDVSVGLCQETREFSGDCFQKANAPVQVKAYYINQILGINYSGSETFCWNVGTISQRSKPRFTKETEDDFEITIDYGSIPCCPSDSDGPGRSRSISLAVKLIPADKNCCGSTNLILVRFRLISLQ